MFESNKCYGKKQDEADENFGSRQRVCIPVLTWPHFNKGLRWEESQQNSYLGEQCYSQREEATAKPYGRGIMHLPGTARRLTRLEQSQQGDERGAIAEF